MKKCKILVPIGCRSDEGLSKPIIDRLQKDNMFEIYVHNIRWPGDFYGSYIDAAFFLGSADRKFDLVLITGDRIEMTAFACEAFHDNISIAHYFGGVLNHPITTYDDINRHCISLWSDIQLVESKICKNNIEILFQSIGKKSNCHVVGITHMDDIVIDESLVPKEEYDLVLYNPTSTKESKKLLFQEIKQNPSIIIGSNPDPNPIKWDVDFPNLFYENLPRAQFLGLLKNCTRFITNSSSAYYEAPYFLKEEQIIMIGDRNKNRTSKSFQVGASNRIIEILKRWWLEKHE